MPESKAPFPPFTRESAITKVRMAENAWNTKDPMNIAMAYTIDSKWRNRSEFINGRDNIVSFLKRKWEKEHEYRLIKELWAYSGERIAVRFAYEWHDENNTWFRAYGNENWKFDSNGLMKTRFASINDLPINASERKFFWDIGPRPDEHLGLTELGL
ncbi:nuclear transport factor 2 family protein [Lentisphaera profundi]|uniref:Nuclear transport factor 2 family protein n=1 Tax=Lentisphaera profundi TaxID=1658616 RepID=A0ABY7VPT9_9BACT|nr:nuclear transport factor 2 family protein [Lentisphaera profundi]WDE96186.1 nuclear transport factor 2 family protein [Lentisphaera profundi]